MFIDASKHFEKVKAQNFLRDSDVERIIKAYIKRDQLEPEKSEKFTHVASLSEIAENDYNLNIPRYVDTFEEEEAVDLNAVATELSDLEAQMQTVDTELSGFCTQLNIKAPFALDKA